MFKSSSLSCVILALGAAVVKGQISISQSCQSSFLSVAASPDANCLNVAGLLTVLTTATTTPNSSLIPPFNSWLATACSEAPCSNSSLANITTTLAQGCSSDLASLGFTGDVNSDLVPIVQQAYPTVRSIACLKESNNNTLCVTDLLNDIQASQGTLSLNGIVSDVTGIANGQISNVPSNVVCTDCMLAAYDVLNAQQPSLAGDADVTNAFASQCGSSFLSSPSPTNVVEGTGSAAPTGAVSGAVSVSAVLGMAASSLAAVTAGFFLLA